MVSNKTSLDALRIDREKRSRSSNPWWLLAVVILITVALVVGWLALRPRATIVRTAQAAETVIGGSSTVLNASGYVTARRRATVSSKVTGKVVEVLIEEGMLVSEGQVLARLDASNVTVSLELAEAKVVAARTALEEVSVRIREAELDLVRAVALVGKKVASQADLDASQAEVDSLRARLEVQRQQVEVAGREVAVWRQQLSDTVIRAPFDGVVVTKDAQPGEMISPVSAGGGFTRTGIGTVVDMGSLEVEVDVNESYINRVSADQVVEATLDAYPEWKIPAHVIAIVPTADRQKATVRVRIGFDELDPRMLPDMGVKVAFRENRDRSEGRVGVAIPAAAIQSADGRAVVFVVAGENAERRAVQVEQSEGSTRIVIAGLSAGEEVVIEGPTDLADGDRVEVNNE